MPDFKLLPMRLNSFYRKNSLNPVSAIRSSALQKQSEEKHPKKKEKCFPGGVPYSLGGLLSLLD